MKKGNCETCGRWDSAPKDGMCRPCISRYSASATGRPRTLGLVVILSLLTAGVLLALFKLWPRGDCLNMSKPETDVTPSRHVSEFTGEEKWILGDLYCMDTNGVLHAYREAK